MAIGERPRGSRDREPTPAPSPTRRACRASHRATPTTATDGCRRRGTRTCARRRWGRRVGGRRARRRTRCLRRRPVGEMPSVALARIDGDGEVRRDAVRESGRSAVSTAMIDARFCRRRRSAMTRSSDGPAATTMAGTPSKAPASASTSPSCATTPRFSMVFRRYGAARWTRRRHWLVHRRRPRAPTAAGAPDILRVLARQHRMDDDRAARASPVDTRRHARSAPR